MEHRNKLPDKLILIYEFNNNSPLFAYAAEQFYKEGNYNTALEILQKGLQLYPEYTTARIIYALTLTKLGQNEEARSQLKMASGLSLSDESYDFYLKIIRESSIEKIENLENTQDQNIEINVETEQGKVFEDNLETLATELETAKVNTSEFNQELIEDFKRKAKANPKKIVSETLAGIYYDQNNWKEALDLYEELIELRPTRKEIYEARIEEIKRHMKN